ncbi:molybdopterin-guanine dinucleotide biosynthesis protein B [Rhizobium rhizosphaerae]|uniref:Molybdopterin-guanine dinucleotide biosynthesis protein B n=1 Tax=Xaviernesmea rhizosphaerae TaxID=1672749 RepID=A0ABX3PJZ7_9HYPH|nr:molybdopterin-guanine dinucleotide biosynthesis protein B [Xaviernesmea rhizosphaerae]OQP88491.1 molybdopterin-guanine dinucleotide biosynthesis protein B [Xaviernesmea rhizosphaerae]
MATASNDTDSAAQSRRPQRVLGVTGWKNSGKTGLVERLVALFTRRGLSVSTIKHAHHGFDIDRPGADSYRHREAGAREVAIVANDRIAIMQELRGAPEPDLVALLARMTPVDLVIVEGYKRAPIPKIEARRRDARAHEPLAPGDPTIFAIAADHPVDDAAVPVIDLDDTEAIADLVAARLGLG